MCLIETKRRQFAAGGDEFASYLPRERQGPKDTNQVLCHRLFGWIARIVAVNPEVGVNDVHGARRGTDRVRVSETSMLSPGPGTSAWLPPCTFLPARHP